MIGHYLLVLDKAAEDRVLTKKMGPGWYAVYGHEERCLIGTTCDAGPSGIRRVVHLHRLYPGRRCPDGTRRGSVEERYDDLCKRFGTERVNAAIRDRVLQNQARRALKRGDAHCSTTIGRGPSREGGGR
jgi:hypothetical protein